MLPNRKFPARKRIASVFGTCLAIAIASWSTVLFAGPLSQARALFSDSVKSVPAGMISSTALSAPDLEEPIEFMVPLRMRNYSELLTRIAKGEIISPAEMAAKYYPLDADYQSVVDWLTSEGFTIVKTDPNHLGVFVSGTVGQVQQALQVNFGKVSVGNATYTSALTAPSVPSLLAPAVLGVNGLQPHIQRHKHSRLIPSAVTPLTANRPPFLTGEILKAYNASGLNVDGSGQKIGIVIDTFPRTNDLSSFWSQCNVNQSLNNIEFVQVVSGTLAAPSGEETLDVEWSSGMASGAKVRVYASRDLSDIHLDQCYQQILNDLPNQPGLRQISLSYGLGELYESTSQMQTDAQYFASMASSGVTVFVSSGDGGSSPSSNGNSNGPTQVENPASDPSVTAVGGTSLYLNSSTGNVSSETTWNGSGGGLSTFFNRPAWQTGTGVPAGTTRVVPDVASAADPNTGCLVILNGSQYQFGGTSWSAPMWAGFCALINQARANASLQPVGLLGPKIYPLIGSTNFQDITSGNNGDYSAGNGYDLCTGVGAPSVATLVQSLTSGNSGGPNLTPYQPAGWSDKLVISNSTGTSTDSTNLQPTDTLYLDWAVTNTGNTATALTFYTALYVDGVLTQTWSVDPPLNPGAYSSISDYSIGSLSPGTHTIRVNVDSTNTVGESNESDNQYTKTITVGSNDDFVDRQILSGGSGTVTGSNVGATKEPGEPFHGGNAGGASIWYSWTAPASGPATFDTFQSSFDTLLAVYTGNSVEGLNFVASNDDANGTLQSRVTFTATAGVTYQIAIDGYNGATGNTLLHWLLSQQTYTISVFASPSAGGTVSGGGSYASGSNVTVTASANNGYNFANWTENGSVVSTSASYTFTANGSRTLVANFTANAINYAISTSASPSSGGATGGDGTFAGGTTVTVIANANSGYSFVNWTENGSVVSTSASYSFTANGNRTLVANFTATAATYQITLAASPRKGGTVTGAGSFAAGSSRTVTAIPKGRYTFVNWTEGESVVVSTTSSYTFTLTGNRNLVANFRRRR
jgi:kumamolisin